MEKDGDQIVETTTEAREGVNVKGMTTVLTVSILLAAIVLALAWWHFAHA